MSFEEDKQARHELAEMYRNYKNPKHVSQAPVGFSLGDLDRLLKAHERITRQECVNAIIGLLASNPVLTNLPAPMVRKQIEEALGLK